MIFDATSKEAVAHLSGGGFKEGFIPVFSSGIQVTTSNRDSAQVSNKATCASYSLVNWAWNISFGKISTSTDFKFYYDKFILTSDRTRENSIASPCYAGIEVKNSTKYSSGGISLQDYEISCMQGEYIKIPIPISAGKIVSIPANMFGLSIINDNTCIAGIVSFLGSKMFTVGTDNGKNINIVLRSDIMKRVY